MSGLGACRDRSWPEQPSLDLMADRAWKYKRANPAVLDVTGILLDKNGIEAWMPLHCCQGRRNILTSSRRSGRVGRGSKGTEAEARREVGIGSGVAIRVEDASNDVPQEAPCNSKLWYPV